MSNLVDHAIRELTAIGMKPQPITEDMDSDDQYSTSVANAVLDLIKLFSEQGHSGFTAPYTVQTFSRLANFEPLGPITGKDEEWGKVSDADGGLWQNKRCSHVFKGTDGRAYDINAIVFKDPDGGHVTGRGSHYYIEFPYRPPEQPVVVERDANGYYVCPPQFKGKQRFADEEKNHLPG